MAMTGTAFLLLLGLAAAASLTGCVRMLPRFAGPGGRRIAARAGLIVATQLGLLLALAATVNAYFNFYASWNDLLGQETGPVRVIDRPAHPGPTVTPLTVAPEKVRVRAGHVDKVMLGGPRTGLTATAYVYLPPEYQAARARVFPAVLVLAADPLRTVTTLRPAAAVYVVMSPGQCVDVVGGAKEEGFLSQDVPTDIAAFYRVGRWGVLGDSCGARLVLRHSDRFAAAVVTSGSYDTPSGNLYGGSPAIRAENDLYWRLAHSAQPPAALLLPSNVQTVRLAGLARPPLHIELSKGPAPDPSVTLHWLLGRIK
ncbi:MAG: putative esterase [Actinomycetia bacterium]|nr:putative esterase [Actinomycetes bacterium]